MADPTRNKSIHVEHDLGCGTLIGIAIIGWVILEIVRTIYGR